MISLNEDIMHECIARAYTAAGFTGTNPLVGAAVVKNRHVVAYGIHEIFGGAHAEVNAINAAGKAAEGADLYVTLEPCSTHGKTPPCTDLIIKSGIKRVFVGIADPNLSHAGEGLKVLKSAGIEVVAGVAGSECALLLERFTKSIKLKKPYVTLKIAMSADGKCATRTGDSKWITSELSRAEVHRMRESSDAVIAGIGTVLADDPMLNARTESPKRQPVRVILDSRCRTPLFSNIVKTAHDVPTIVFVLESAEHQRIAALEKAGVTVEIVEYEECGKLPLDAVLKRLYSMNMMNVMVEGGPSVFGSFIDSGEADAAKIFIAPKIIGSQAAISAIGGEGVAQMNDVATFVSTKVSAFGNDILLDSRIKDYTAEVLEITRKCQE